MLENEVIFTLRKHVHVIYREAGLTSTDNLCFGAKISKIGTPCKPQFCYIKVGYKGGKYFADMFPDVKLFIQPKRESVR